MRDESILPEWLAGGRRRFLFLLAFLMVFIFLGPFIKTNDRGLSLYDGLFTAMLIVGAYSASKKKSSLVIASGLALPAVALVWLDHFDPSTSYAVPRYVLALLFFSFTAGTILSHVLKAERVTFDKICAALCSYLLLGLIFAILYSLLEFLNPGTFLAGGEVIPQGDPRAFYGAGMGQAIYFSFTTLTTLGYGDIAGATPLAKNLSVLEALIGQIYLVVLVARLVGMEISHSSDKKPS
jgi:voltage-gated potassium channel